MTVPVTFTAAEFQELLQAIAARDPLIAALLRKQAEAQAALEAQMEYTQAHDSRIAAGESQPKGNA